MCLAFPGEWAEFPPKLQCFGMAGRTQKTAYGNTQAEVDNREADSPRTGRLPASEATRMAARESQQQFDDLVAMRLDVEEQTR